MTTSHADLLRMLAELRLHHTADNLDDLVARWTKAHLGPREIIEDLARLEQAERGRRSVDRRMADAHIGKFKPLADYFAAPQN